MRRCLKGDLLRVRFLLFSLLGEGERLWARRLGDLLRVRLPLSGRLARGTGVGDLEVSLDELEELDDELELVPLPVLLTTCLAMSNKPIKIEKNFGFLLVYTCLIEDETCCLLSRVPFPLTCVSFQPVGL